MHKHKRRQQPGTKRLANANLELPAVCTDRIKSIIDGLDEEDFAAGYLRREYLSKFCGTGTATPQERRSAAIAKWRESERTNALTNVRLRGMDRGYNILPRVTFYNFLRVAQHQIAEVLGPLSDELVLGSFSGGASTGRRRTESQPAQKFCGMADVTKDATLYVDVIHRLSDLYRKYGVFYSLHETEGAVLFTVPKNSNIDRCACKEPEVNMFLQKGVGSYIRKRLRRFGINLNDQSVNRGLARLGSVTGELATIDLSAASDSITVSCVEALLPREWFLYLNDIRSRNVVVDGEIIETEMFSSMGNGFTFELESLIFWALMKATAYLTNTPGVISVYGDDIIIPNGMFMEASIVLRAFGFALNLNKSFDSTPFRESCGGHYYNGTDVTPFYLRREPTRLTDLIRVANQLRRWALTDGARQYIHSSLFGLWTELAQYVPADLRGGYDLALDTQLVDWKPTRNRLVRISEKVTLPPVGEYMHWHTLNRDRTRDPEMGYPAMATNQMCRRRRAKPGAVTRDWLFREEW
jgi:hypothetical protein